MTVEIREVDQLSDLRRVSNLLGEVWGRLGEPPLSTDMLRALTHSGSYVAGAFAEARLVGALIGWLAGDPRTELHLHSHILGVLPDAATQGTGFQLKQHQRLWCLARGIRLVEWTTDPLVGRNVYFNIAKLGARAPEYLVNFYGDMRDGINAGEESDRLLIEWRLDSPAAVAAAAGRSREPDVDQLAGEGAHVVVRAAASGAPVVSRGRSRVLLCQVPNDIVEVRRADPATSRSWRLALRTALTDAMDAGYAITGATRRGWYVLESVSS